MNASEMTALAQAVKLQKELYANSAAQRKKAEDECRARADAEKNIPRLEERIRDKASKGGTSLDVTYESGDYYHEYIKALRKHFSDSGFKVEFSQFQPCDECHNVPIMIISW